MKINPGAFKINDVLSFFRLFPIVTQSCQKVLNGIQFSPKDLLSCWLFESALTLILYTSVFFVVIVVAQNIHTTAIFLYCEMLFRLMVQIFFGCYSTQPHNWTEFVCLCLDEFGKNIYKPRRVLPQIYMIFGHVLFIFKWYV